MRRRCRSHRIVEEGALSCNRQWGAFVHCSRSLQRAAGTRYRKMESCTGKAANSRVSFRHPQIPFWTQFSCSRANRGPTPENCLCPHVASDVLRGQEAIACERASCCVYADISSPEYEHLCVRMVPEAPQNAEMLRSRSVSSEFGMSGSSPTSMQGRRPRQNACFSILDTYPMPEVSPSRPL